MTLTILSCYLAGLSHRPAETLDHLHEGDNLVFLPEPSNQFDARAVKVLTNTPEGAYFIGYVPKEATTSIHSALRHGLTPLGIINKIDSGKRFPQITIHATVDLPTVETITPLRPTDFNPNQS